MLPRHLSELDGSASVPGGRTLPCHLVAPFAYKFTILQTSHKGKSMNLSTRIARRIAFGSLLTLCVAFAAPGASTADEKDTGKQRIGLEGYCPVCIVEGHKWMKGNPDIQATYDGVTYQFPNEALKKTFIANPAKYVPALGGDCIVCYAMAGKRVPGNIRHSATLGGRLYLFPSDREKEAFLATPSKFAKADLALNGDCAVCLTHAKKRVPGKSEFTAIHNALRYEFPSDRERQMFVRNPERYAQNPAKAAADARTDSTDGKVITVSGKTACAGCEYGVTPIGAPNELGLALNTVDGQVIVVENAHTKWPSIYKARYDGQKVEAKGRVIRTRGKTKWFEPIELKVL